MKTKKMLILPFVLLLCFIAISSYGQSSIDTTNLPKISIQSINGFGPYLIGSKRTNFFITDSMPENTSRVVFRMIDSNGETINSGHTIEGQNLQQCFWQFEADTMDYSIATKLNVEVTYTGDSIANYYIPYLIEARPIEFEASAGWGPFITNNYQLNDTAWQPVPEKLNTFKASVLPPRTDTVMFSIYSIDSSLIQQHVVIGENGQYLDSAFYEGVRMDQLPMNTKRIDLVALCEGGPDDGFKVSRELVIQPQKPKLICKTKDQVLQDSIPLIVEKYNYGQALSIDTNKYVDILNRPGIEKIFSGGVSHYAGPYSIDFLNESYSIEAWYKFNHDALGNENGQMTVLTVDSLWGLMFHSTADVNHAFLQFKSFVGGDEQYLFGALIEIDATSWNHVAVTCNTIANKTEHEIHVYCNGEPMDVDINQQNYNYVSANYNIDDNRKTKHLSIGGKGETPYNKKVVEAIDEIRVWDYARSTEQIEQNYSCSVLQDQSLLGYWSFNDRRNRLKQISDLSFYNNTGILQNGCMFIPQDINVEYFPDSLTLISSNIETSSVVFEFYNFDNTLVLSKSVSASNGIASLRYDLSDLPRDVNKLIVKEYFPGSDTARCQSSYPMDIHPYTPMATPKYNWSTFYQSDNTNDKILNEILVSNLPNNVYKVELGLEKDGETFDDSTFYENSIPHRYGVHLDGTNNYIETSNNGTVPVTGSYSLWFKTTSLKGGKLMGFGTTQNGVNSYRDERELLLEKDGSIRFVVNEHATLYGLHAHNDGEWHHVEVTFGQSGADLFVDGSMVDTKSTAGMEAYNGFWILGRNHHDKNSQNKSLAEYFQGAITEVHIYSESYNNNYHIHLKMNEGVGVDIKDYGTDNNNGNLVGSTIGWLNISERISFVNWKGNMVNKSPGTYNAYARIFYNHGPEQGVEYILGRFNIIDPIVDCDFAYNLGKGIGYFNEGTQLVNGIEVTTNYSLALPSDAYEYFVRCSFLSPENSIIDSEIETYTEPNQVLNYNIDMGEAPKGSYLVFDYGFMDGEEPNIQGLFSFPIYIHRMIAPIVNVNTGPFMQAIAPGTMAQPNTVTITTEHFDDLNRITGNFYSNTGELVAYNDADKINDTTWTFTRNMGPLPPPGVSLKLEYFLGSNPNPVLTDGPYHMTINKSRPPWFDFLADTSFHDITEDGDSVTFSLSTYLVSHNKYPNRSSYTIPRGVPFLGGSSYANLAPSMVAHLKYVKSQDSLMLGQVPELKQVVAEFYAGPEYLMHIDFGAFGNDKYYLDTDKNLIAIQNTAHYIDFSFNLKKFLKNPMIEFMEVYKKLKMNDWKHSKIVGPSFAIFLKSTLGWATRLNYKYDTINRNWGSFGNLDIDANPDHHQAYNNSSSYYFGYMGLTGQIAAEMTFAGGLADIYAGISLGVYVGKGRSYITIPNADHRWKTSCNLTISYRIWAEMLWGWYEVDIYGPKAIVKVKLTGDDMSSCFPPFDDKQLSDFCTEDDKCLADSLLVFDPVGWYHKMPLPKPDFSMVETPYKDVVGWIEPGKRFGEREICFRLFDRAEKRFSDKMVVLSNRNAIHQPEFTMLDEKHVLVTWTQSRHNPETILESKPNELMVEMVNSFDVWYAIYNIDSQQVVVLQQIEDDVSGFASGRPEGKPKLVNLTNQQALLVWKVGSSDFSSTSLWYITIKNENSQWTATEPMAFEDQGGIVTAMKLASVGEGQAVLTWAFYESEVYEYNTLCSAFFNGNSWQDTEVLFPEDSTLHYNFFDLHFHNETGAMIYTTVDSDINSEASEKLWLMNWNNTQNAWNQVSEIIYSNNDEHIQCPNIIIDDTGDAIVAYKLSKSGLKEAESRLSQTNLMIGNISGPGTYWETILANTFVCDTTKEIGALGLMNVGGDTLLILSQEYLMTATNAPYTPINGIAFGDDRMNMVLRSVKLTPNLEIEDLNEGLYFTEIYEPVDYYDVSLEQNIPNPCRNSSSIRFYLASGQHVLLEVLNLKGVRVGTLVNAQLAPGYYESVINTSSLEPGTYIIQLSSGKTKKSVKMIVCH